MNANELRLGNIIFISGPIQKTAVVNAIGNNSIHAKTDDYDHGGPGILKESVGIPLTEELLVKNGFLDKTGGYRGTGVEVIFELQAPGALIMLSKGNKPPFDYWVFPFYGTEIRFLHQLQNLHFVITGEELNISL